MNLLNLLLSANQHGMWEHLKLETNGGSKPPTVDAVASPRAEDLLCGCLGFYHRNIAADREVRSYALSVGLESTHFSKAVSREAWEGNWRPRYLDYVTAEYMFVREELDRKWAQAALAGAAFELHDFLVATTLARHLVKLSMVRSKINEVNQLLRDAESDAAGLRKVRRIALEI